jgi:hypothetical protein
MSARPQGIYDPSPDNIAYLEGSNPATRKASDFLRNKSEYLRERVAGAAEIARQHPVYAVVALGILGLGIGFALSRRGRP